MSNSGELQLKGIGGSETLRIKTGTEAFDRPSNPTGTLTTETTQPLALKLGPAPETVKGVPVGDDGKPLTPLMQKYIKLEENLKGDEKRLTELKKKKEDLEQQIKLVKEKLK